MALARNAGCNTAWFISSFQSRWTNQSRGPKGFDAPHADTKKLGGFEMAPPEAILGPKSAELGEGLVYDPVSRPNDNFRVSHSNAARERSRPSESVSLD